MVLRKAIATYGIRSMRDIVARRTGKCGEVSAEFGATGCLMVQFGWPSMRHKISLGSLFETGRSFPGEMA